MTTIANLPDDLEWEILARVPAKSLQELRTTCKRWDALFRDPKFVEKNKKLSKGVRASLLVSNKDVYSIAVDLHNSSVELTGKLRSSEGSKDMNFYRIYHCDGLMLCQTKEISRLVVWNPCTGQTRLIRPRTCYRGDDTFALGYNASSSLGYNSYKILRYHWNYKNGQPFAAGEMYELSSDSWRVLDSFPLDHYLYYSGLSLKGDAYWIANGKETGCFLMKFDFTTETFVRLPLPFQILDPGNGKASLSVVKDEKLSVLHRYVFAGSNVMKIWVSNNVYEEEELSWRSHLVLKVDCDKFYISSVVNLASFLLDEENKVAICCDMEFDEYKTRIYIAGGDGMFKRVYNGLVNPSCSTWPRLITYVPSLVHIHKCTPKRGKKKNGRLLALK